MNSAQKIVQQNIDTIRQKMAVCDDLQQQIDAIDAPYKMDVSDIPDGKTVADCMEGYPYRKVEGIRRLLSVAQTDLYIHLSASRLLDDMQMLLDESTNIADNNKIS